MEIRRIEAKAVTDTVKELFLRCNYEIGQDILDALAQARAGRDSENFPNIQRQFLSYCELWQRKVDALEEELTAEDPQDRREMAARELLRFERPGRTTIQALVKKIVVCGDKSLELYFSFPDPRITP